MHSAPATLVVPDIHHRTGAVDRILRRLRGQYRQVVYLGDYFDSFDDSPDVMRATVSWLADSVVRGGIHLLGNHDLAYFFPKDPQARCPGWTSEKQAVFEEFRDQLPVSRFGLACRVGPWLISHAGVHRSLIEDAFTADKAIEKAEQDIRRRQPNRLFQAGRARGGGHAVGGITWLDFVQEFEPVPGLNQIVGHTPALGIVRGKHLDTEGRRVASEHYDVGVTTGNPLQPTPGAGSANYCLDSDLKLVGLVDDSGIHFVPTGVD